MLELRQVRKHYSTAAGPLEVLRGIDLRLDKGQSASIVGPSGCGKSTLLNLIGGLDKPDEGAVWVEGRDLSTMNEEALADFRNRFVGFVFQQHHLLPQCTVLENVLLPALACGRLREEPSALQRRAMELLDQVGLADRAGELPGRLSGGQRQRAAVARALLLRPVLLLADEPTGSLDEQTAVSVINLLDEVHRLYGLTLIVVTHSALLAARMQRRFVLSGGLLSEQTQDPVR
ncbi:MAG TPA: ABC transporter ATP-binding protein [Anaerohalosphaeraceae bacterium]|nr:ABC transporter ATP-binding protein [Anaerohalosphaeraceae bacterium]HOL88809.1 ABC transporter ATP-binding protein [Anaerohalosphaeraceae bacterium]HPP55681.1 ABC transporter ATP-binding protein [Anaerohalosphaeraceae bacterium]